MHGSARDRFAHSRANPDDSVAPQRRVGQPAEASAQHRPSDAQYAFLLQAGVSGATLAIAEAEARRCGVATHQVLLAAGFVSQTAYISALAGWLGVPVAGWDAAFHLETPGDADDVKAQGVAAHLGGRSYRVLCAEDGTPGVLREHSEPAGARFGTSQGRLHGALGRMRQDSAR